MSLPNCPKCVYEDGNLLVCPVCA